MAYHMKEIIITVSVLIICILLVRRIFRRKIGSRFQYALWLLVALRLVIPVSIPVSLPMAEFMDPYHLMGFDTDEVVEQLEQPIQVTIHSGNIYHLLAEDSEQTADNASGETGGARMFFMAGHLGYSWLDVLGILWTGGMLIVAAWILLTNRIFYHRLKKSRKIAELSMEAESALRERLPRKVIRTYERIRIYTAEDLVSPCLYGMPGREAVYLTPELIEDTNRLCHVLTHELCHRKHGDSFWGILRGLLVTVYWFHPLVWVAAVLSKRDCELACDEAALMLLGEEERISYGETLLSIITRKARVFDLLCNATTMTGNGKSVKERIGFIAKKPQILRTAVALTAILMTVVFGFAITRHHERVRIAVFGQDMDTVTGADMQIPLPDNIRGICGQVTEKGKDDVIIYHVPSRQEVGRFARLKLKDVLQLVDEGREVVPIGEYGDNYLLKAYLGTSGETVEVTTHTYTPAGLDDEAEVGVLAHEDVIISYTPEGTGAVPGTDSNTEANGTTQIPAPEETDSQGIFLPYEEGQSLDAEELARKDEEGCVEYLPNEEIHTTTIYPAKEVNVDELSHIGCYVYIKADYSKVEERYYQVLEQLSDELEEAVQDVVVLSLNGEIREELLNTLTDNRTPYVGDNSKVGALVHALPVPSALNFRGDISLQTMEAPYSLRFEYEMTTSSLPEEDSDLMYFNAAMLFYAIGNVDEIMMYIRYPIGSDTASSVYVYYRTDMEKAHEGLSGADYENGQVFREGLESLHMDVVEYLHSRE